jgi:hypothetical protein
MKQVYIILCMPSSSIYSAFQISDVSSFIVCFYLLNIPSCPSMNLQTLKSVLLPSINFEHSSSNRGL